MTRPDLRLFLNPNSQAERPAPVPTLGELAYSPPNPDGSRKSCSNCVQWRASDEVCWLHGPDLPAVADAVCSYHVFGQPQPGALQPNERPLLPLVPELSGFQQPATGDGASCDVCTWYRSEGLASGRCLAARDEDARAPAQVEAKGRCSRWREG